jgi:putative ubiquitin-RnfH superfamily antitoxin RatB of RatAB toxin-antitoxin module
MAEASITVEVVHAAADRQWLQTLQLPANATVSDALRLSQIATQFPELDLAQCALGIFGRVVPADRMLEPGDRVEIYRPLMVDPKEVRRLRAAKAAKVRQR